MLVVGDDQVEVVQQIRKAGADAQPGHLDGELWNIARGLFSSSEAQRFLLLTVEAYEAHDKLVNAFLRHFHCWPLFTNGAADSLPLAEAFHHVGALDTAMLEALASQAKSKVPHIQEPSSSEPATLNILVAEDHPTNATIVRRMLEGMGHQVEIAGDGQAAVDAFTQRGADLILMDLQMPIMGGHDACRAIRLLPDGKDIPILALTAHATAEERQRSMDAGMDDHLTKPFTRAQLTSAIQLWGTSLRNPEKLP
jgi:CheY-like chemotaxis protein